LILMKLFLIFDENDSVLIRGYNSALRCGTRNN
jgi:hypothetical protein